MIRTTTQSSGRAILSPSLSPPHTPPYTLPLSAVAIATAPRVGTTHGAVYSARVENPADERSLSPVRRLTGDARLVPTLFEDGPADAPDGPRNGDRRRGGGSGSGRGSKATPEQLQAVWNEHRGKLAEWRFMSSGRRRMAIQRLRELDDLGEWVKVVQVIAVSRFCNGANDRGWKADPEFLLRPNTWPRALEGTIASWGGNGRPMLKTNGTPAEQRRQAVEHGNARGVASKLRGIIQDDDEA